MSRPGTRPGAEQNCCTSEGRHGIAAERQDRNDSKRRQIMKRNVFTILCLAAAGLAGCASPTPILDENFGNAVRTVRAMQTVNPDAGRNPDPVAGMDGTAANESIRRYHDSFKTPPPVTNVINIGGGIGGGSGSGGK